MTTTANSGRFATLQDRHDVRAFVPGPYNRKENKPLDQGARFEHAVKESLRDQGVDVWRNPGIRAKRLSDKGMVPDYGAHLPALDRYVDRVVPAISGRPQYNVIGSLKSQTVSGSAEHKISTEIMDMAWGADVDRVVPFVVIDSSIFTWGQIAGWKALGDLEMVVVLTSEELTAQRLEQELLAMGRRRSRMYARMRTNGSLPARKGSYRYSRFERRYLDRRHQHRAAAFANDLAAG